MTDTTARPTPQNPRLRVAHLNARADNAFDLAPDAARRRAIADALDLIDLPRLRMVGVVRASGRDGWALEARLSARVVQPCVVTLAPVTSDLADAVARLYSPHVTAPEDDEVEMGDELLEPLGAFIDLDAVMVEALSLALPLYPRADGADMPAAAVDDAPDAPTRRPFAGLADLMRKGD